MSKDFDARPDRLASANALKETLLDRASVDPPETSEEADARLAERLSAMASALAGAQRPDCK